MRREAGVGPVWAGDAVRVGCGARQGGVGAGWPGRVGAGAGGLSATSRAVTLAGRELVGLDWAGGAWDRRWRVRCWRDVGACSGRPGGPGGGGGVRRSRLPAPAGRLRRATGTRRRNRRGSGGKAPGRTAARTGTVAAGRGVRGHRGPAGPLTAEPRPSGGGSINGQGWVATQSGSNNTARLDTARRKQELRGGLGGCGGGGHVNAACDLGRRVARGENLAGWTAAQWRSHTRRA